MIQETRLLKGPDEDEGEDPLGGGPTKPIQVSCLVLVGGGLYNVGLVSISDCITVFSGY